mgnify:CR=1 FL=1
MGLGLGSLFLATILVLNGLAILNEERFLRRIGWGYEENLQEPPSFKKQVFTLLYAVRVLLRGARRGAAGRRPCARARRARPVLNRGMRAARARLARVHHAGPQCRSSGSTCSRSSSSCSWGDCPLFLDLPARITARAPVGLDLGVAEAAQGRRRESRRQKRPWPQDHCRRSPPDARHRQESARVLVVARVLT